MHHYNNKMACETLIALLKNKILMIYTNKKWLLFDI